MRKCLCVGIDSYQNVPDLHGCVNDAVSVKEALARNGDGSLILAGVYATYSKWINIENELAKEMGKKIIAVVPRGAESISKAVNDNANEIVKWNTDSIVKAVTNN